MPPTRTDLARRGMLKADEVRDRFDIPPHSAVNVFDLCGERFSPAILVRFKDISMEGLYLRQARPEIWVGLRPLVRRTFNCAHELGHHVFGHGSTLDELIADGDARPFKPDEILVDAFASYLLMPRLAVTNAFRLRGWRPEDAVPEHYFVVACSLGVGYETLVNHSFFSLGLIADLDYRRLVKTDLPAIRRQMLGDHAPDRLLAIDAQHTLPTADTEVGTTILLPAGTSTEKENLVHVSDTARGRLFRAARPGVARVFTTDGAWAALIRIMQDQYHGLARHRHFPREDGDDE